MNRWTKIAVGFVAALALAGVTVSVDGGGAVANGRTWADGPAAGTGVVAH
jgi:hypothetical protein